MSRTPIDAPASAQETIMSDNLSQLIEKIEAAGGPDRGLDVRIGVAARWLPLDGQDWLRDWRGDFGPMPRMTGRIAAFHDNGDPTIHWEAPNFTASLDAAVRLVPEGWRVSKMDEGWLSRLWHVQLAERPTDSQREAYAAGQTIGWNTREGDCATPALALCAAALKARSKENPHVG